MEYDPLTDLPDEKVGNWARTVVTDNVWNGTTTKYHFQDNSFIVEKQYDADPFLKAAEVGRQQTEGQDYGDYAKLGTVPPAEHSYFLQRQARHNLSHDEYMTEMLQWLMNNPLLVHHDKYTKAGAPNRKIYVPPGAK